MGSTRAGVAATAAPSMSMAGVVLLSNDDCVLAMMVVDEGSEDRSDGEQDAVHDTKGK